MSATTESVFFHHLIPSNTPLTPPILLPGPAAGVLLTKREPMEEKGTEDKDNSSGLLLSPDEGGLHPGKHTHTSVTG